METKFISIPTKKTNEFDWSHALKNYFTQMYGSYSDFENEVTIFSKLRTDLVYCNNDIVGKDLYYRYYGQLELLELRVPTESLETSFTWYDAFSPSKSDTQHSSAFEKASILFNLAAILSEIGSTAEEFKVSYDCFQKASGLFQFIQENFLHAPSEDLRVDAVRSMAKLMLAQAQESFLLKYMNDNESPKESLVSKLSKATSKLFHSAYEAMKEIKLIKWSWYHNCKLKELFYLSQANYYHAISLKNLSKVGEAIAYMKVADESLSGHAQYMSFFDKELPLRIKKHLDIVRAELTSLEKDNDFIYHDIIPSSLSLTEVKPMESAKAIPINEQNMDTIVGKDLFEKIIPLSVHEQSSLYSEEMAKVLRAEDERCEIADNEFKSTLEFLSLPKSLDELKTLVDESTDDTYSGDGDDSDEIDARVLSIASEISQSDIDETKQTNFKSQIMENLNQADKSIGKESQNFDSYKSKYGNLWTQEQYPAQLMTIRQELSKGKKSMLDSADADDKIKSFFDSVKSDIDILKLGPSHPKFLASFKPSDPSTVANPSVSLLDMDGPPDMGPVKARISKMQTKLQELRYLQKERSNTYQDLKKEIHSDDISSILILNKNDENINDVFKEGLSKFKPYQDRLAITIEKQIPLIDDLKRLMSETLDDPVIKSNIKRREKALSTKKAITARYLACYENWKMYEKGFKQGLGFYSQLLQFSTNLKFTAEKFLSDRINESNRLVQEIEANGPSRDQDLLRQQFSKFSVSSGTSPKASVSFSTGQRVQPEQYSSPYSPAPPPYQYKPYQHEQQTQQQTQPQSAPNFFPTGSSAPPLPSKPSYLPSGYNQQQPPGTDFYSTPSAYDPSLYSMFGNQGTK